MNRPLLAITLLVPLTALSPATQAAAASLAPHSLRCEHRNNPLGIGELRPRLDWQLAAEDCSARGLRQTAYQVLVASSAEGLARDSGDVWDSGRVSSVDTCNIIYAGRALEARSACWWKVRIWDEEGNVSAWSEPARWTVGLLEPRHWRAEWIGFDAAPPDGQPVPAEDQRVRLAQAPWLGAPLAVSRTDPLHAAFRRVIHVPAQPSRATLLVTADMRCRISVNGTSIGEVTRWDRATPLSLTSALTTGENVIGLSVTQDDGYPPAVLGELELAFPDGTQVRYPVDATWSCSARPAPGWDRPGFEASDWTPGVPLLQDGKIKNSPWGTPENTFHVLTPVHMLRRAFEVTKPVRQATVYATALGLYELHLNGSRVGSDYLTPGWTEYRRRVHYQTYDVTAQLRPGPNAVGALLGDGWFAGVAGYTGRRGFYGTKPRFRAQLEIEYEDGTRELVGTDGSWRAAPSHIQYSDLYLGASHDERLAIPDWTDPGFDDRAWRRVATGLPDDARHGFVVEAATMEPVRIIDELPARTVTEPVKGRYVVDLGQNLVGWIRLRAHGRPGQQVTLRHGEMLNPNGTIYTSNLRGASATDVFRLRGGGETLEPFGTFHGFRYVEITGLDAAPQVADVTGVVVHNPMPRTGGFTSSDPLLNQLFHNIVWGQKGNYLETPMDCPQRDERLGWTGDTQFFIRTGLFNFDAQSFIERWLTTLITDSQGENGAFPSTAPAVGHKPEAVTAWGDAALVCTHALWQVYGDTRVIERHFDAMARYVETLRSRARDGIVSIGGYGDWLNLGGGAKREVMDTAYYAYLSGLMAEMAAALGRHPEAARFAAERDAVRAAWQRAFLKPDGTILESSQTGYALAFTMDLVPEELRQVAADRFVGEIAAKDWHLATGFIGTPRLLPGLHAAGRNDVAYRLLQTKTYPSWLFQVTLGATTMWERWDGWTPDRGFQNIGMNSFNHYAFGAVGQYLYQNVLGIDTLGAGFRHVLIAPRPGGTLTYASGHYHAITGRIASEWRRDGAQFALRVEVPPNAHALIRVPATDASTVREGGRPATQAPGVRLERTEPDAVVFSVGSGTYEFTSTYAPAPGA